MRILLLSPPVPEVCRPVISPPLGLGYIAGVAQRARCQVSLFDCSSLPYDTCARLLKESTPDIVGITSNTGVRHEALRLARLVKDIRPNSVLILGGPHASALPELILTHCDEVDVIVRGEGEQTFLDLLQRFESGRLSQELGSVKGVSYRDDGRIVHTEERDSIRDLDSLPYPGWEFFDLNEYNRRKTVDKFDVANLLHLKAAPMITSRGCPYRCTFCYSDFWGRGYRARSAVNVVDEMELLKRNYGVEYIRFFDDDFIFSRKRTIEICGEILRRGLHRKVVWRCEGRVDHADEELFRTLKKAGCHLIEFGIESGSQPILDNLRKQITVDQIRYAFELAHRVGLETRALLMIGNPGETMQTVRDTIRLLGQVKPTYVLAEPLTVMPKTEIYGDMLRRGEMQEETWLDDSVLFPLYTVGHSREEIERMILYYKVGSLLARRDFRGLLRGALNRYVLKRLRRGTASRPLLQTGV